MASAPAKLSSLPIPQAALTLAGAAWLALCVATLIFAAALDQRAGEHFLWEGMTVLAFPASYVAMGVALIGGIAGQIFLALSPNAWIALPLAWLCFLIAGYLQWFVLVPKLVRTLRRRAAVPVPAAAPRRIGRLLLGAAVLAGVGGAAFASRGAAFFCPAAWTSAPVMDPAQQARALADIASREHAAQPVRLLAARHAQRIRDAVTEAWTVDIDGRQQAYTVFVTLRPERRLCRPAFWFASRGHPGNLAGGKLPR
jgi:hypothetical protein